MTKKVKLLSTIISLLTVLSFAQVSYAFKFSNNVSPSGEPVAGGVGATGVTITPGDFCVSKKCNDLRLQIGSIQKQIDEDDLKLETLVNNLTDSRIEKLRSEINQLQNKKLSKEEGILLSKKILELVAIAETVSPEVATLKERILSNKVQVQIIKEQIDEIATDEDKESGMDSGVEEKDDSSQDETDTDDESSSYEYDVNPISYSLNSGDLVAWGIPGVGVPSIPRVSAPQHEQKNITEKKVSDESYNALRVVETESIKISDSDKDTFLMQLNSLTSESN